MSLSLSVLSVVARWITTRKTGLSRGGVALTAVMNQNVSLGEVMTTEIIHKDAPCGKQFRVKRWETGYSVKCLHKRKTIVVRPYDEEFYQKDLNLFCTGCEKAKRQCLET